MRPSIPAVIAVAAISAPLIGIALARQGQEERPAQNARQFTGDALVQGLRSTPGCLGVESGTMTSGKQVIIAFFENKQAAMNWYNHPMHTRLRQNFPGFDPERAPMQHVPETGPVVALASISFAGKPAIEGSPIPFSHIAIELYAPVRGGLSIGGGFAPDAFHALVNKED